MQKPPRTGITAFCGCPDIEARMWMLKPWMEGEHIYATNGHILLELPRASNALLDVAEKSRGKWPASNRMSSPRSRSGDRWMLTTLRRK